MGLTSHDAYEIPAETDGLYGMMISKGYRSLADNVYSLLVAGRDQAKEHEDRFMQELAENQTEESCQESTLDNQQAPLCVSHKISKQLSDLYKVDLRAALLLENSKPVEGDGD